MQWPVVWLSRLLKHHSLPLVGSAVLPALQLEVGMPAEGLGVEDLELLLAEFLHLVGHHTAWACTRRSEERNRLAEGLEGP